jgi:hypothetical protein
LKTGILLAEIQAKMCGAPNFKTKTARKTRMDRDENLLQMSSSILRSHLLVNIGLIMHDLYQI